MDSWSEEDLRAALKTLSDAFDASTGHNHSDDSGMGPSVGAFHAATSSGIRR
jgi:hypothetical protein